MNKKNYDIITILCAFLIVILLSFIPKSNVEKTIVSENKFSKNMKYITNKVGNNYTLVNRIELSNDIVNILYKNNETDDYKSYFIDKESGEIVTYKTLLKAGAEDLFRETELKLLNEKYPKFIVEGITSPDTKREVFIKNNSLVIQYSNVITNPKCNDKLSLIINYHEINNLLNYFHDLDEEYTNESGYDYDPTKKYIAFTFDDGPNKNNTNDIVNYLNDNKMRATFFMVGYLMKEYPDIVKNVYDNKMEIGSHSWAHKNLTKQKIDIISSEMNETDSVYKNITGDNIKLMRPPYGAINNKVKENFNYAFIKWNIDTNDWKYKDENHLYDYVINNVSDGDIVLMHDLQSSTKNGMEKLLPELYVRGFRVVSVSELANIKNKSLENHKVYFSLK